ncbi:MAG TPA: TetR/AcrR family transcriptional regulator [Gemmatimonadales bacterium]|nr:TetR/AcrR family transcriptional regulator [Gemmatimonadales bacterium]
MTIEQREALDQEGPDDSQHRRRLQPEERRAEIFDAALAVFSELGYDRATLNDVVERIGVSKGCLYHHFDSKEQLLLELMRVRLGCTFEESDEVPASNESREAALRARLDAIWQHFQRPGQLDLMTLAINEFPKIPEAGRVLFEEVVTRKRENLRQALDRGNQCGAASPEDIQMAALMIPWMIMGVALGVHQFRRIDPLKLSPEQVGKAVTNMILNGIGGVCAEEPDEA